jgi:hypothetical protein
MVNYKYIPQNDMLQFHDQDDQLSLMFRHYSYLEEINRINTLAVLLTYGLSLLKLANKVKVR